MNDLETRKDSSVDGFCKNVVSDEICEAIDDSFQGLYNVLKAMKERETVLVVKRKVMGMLVWCCGSCGVAITDGDKFCRMCGQDVKWE